MTFFLNAHETRFYLIINLRMHYETGYIIHKCVNSEEWNKCSSVHRLSLPHSPKIPIWYLIFYIILVCQFDLINNDCHRSFICGCVLYI